MFDWTYNSPGPVASQFGKSRAFIAGLRGPVGSGKSTTAVMKLITNARRQARQSDGWIRRRSVIFRNTMPELKSTTIPTWHQWVPPSVGSWTEGSPIEHHIVDVTNRFDWKVWFVGLDKPKDVRKILSMELSDAWGNEAREAPKVIIDGLTERIGRYPPRSTGGATDVQLILDTNSMDTDHWWYVLAERDTSNERNLQIVQSMLDAEKVLREQGLLAAHQPLMEFFSQPSGESELAENVHNLRPGYYTFSKAGKTEQHIDVYIRNKYGFVQEGKPVYPEYRDELMFSAELVARKELPIHIGMDFGLTPAAVIEQQATNGRWFAIDELVATRMGAKNFAIELARKLKQDYRDFTIGSMTGDPAGDAGLPDDEEKTVFTVLKANGIDAKPAYSNDFTVRRDTYADPMTQLIDGKPGFTIGPKAPILRKALGGKYCLQRLQIVGADRYRDHPLKNEWSHVAEAGQYCRMGAGEGKKLLGVKPKTNRPKFALT